MSDAAWDDVIRIRIDTAWAVDNFLAILKGQAAEGETDAPANPANRAVFRELAPYRLVEYEYVGGSVGRVEGAYIGFPDGVLYSVAELIPEEAVNALLTIQPPPPLYVYVVLAVPASREAIDHYLDALASHIGLPQVAVSSLGVAGIHYGAEAVGDAERALLLLAATAAAREVDRHFAKADLLALAAGRSALPDGRAFAQVTYGYIRHVLEFSTAADRDDFVAWTAKLCEMIGATAVTWEEFGIDQFFRPARPCAAPPAGARTVTVAAPNRFQIGNPWAAFGGHDASSARSYTDGQELDEAVLRRSIVIANEYWNVVTVVLAEENAAIRRAALSQAAAK